MYYKLIAYKNLEEFERAISSALYLGWEFYGELLIADGYFIREMVKGRS